MPKSLSSIRNNKLRSWLIVMGSLLMACYLTACAEGHCRRKDLTMPAYPGEEEVIKGVTSKDLNNKDDRVWIYKYDGSLQCNMGITLSLEKTKKELQGLTVFSQEKRNDRLARIQVCGSPTGMANVYEIHNNDLGMAKKRGFKVWDY